MSLQGPIVIIEPDDLIRALMVRWLAEAGYRVLAAPKDHNSSMDMAGPGTASLVIADISDPATATSTKPFAREELLAAVNEGAQQS